MRASAARSPKAPKAPARVRVKRRVSAASFKLSAATVTAMVWLPAAVKVKAPPSPARLAVVLQSADSTPVTAQSTSSAPGLPSALGGMAPATVTAKLTVSPSLTSSASLSVSRSPAGAVAATLTAAGVMVRVSGAASNSRGESAAAPSCALRVTTMVSGSSAMLSLRMRRSISPRARAPVGICTLPVAAVASKARVGASVRAVTS